MNKSRTRALGVAHNLGIKVVETEEKDAPNGQWIIGRTITVKKKADAYTILHEIGHVLCGYMCCNEHCEFAAHGAAIALSKVYGIRINPKSAKRIYLAAGRSSHLACGAIQENHRRELGSSTRRWRDRR